MRSCVALCLMMFALTASVTAQDTVQVQAGWNIIGSVKAGAVPDVLTTDPPGIITTSFFGYSPGGGYLPTETLEKGLGYWMKVSADGIIIFNTSGGSGCGFKTVTYDGTTYGTVQIGNQCWLDRNLDAGSMIPVGVIQADNGTVEKYCYNDLAANCASYGGLYVWNETMQYTTAEGVQGICPPGWHIPTDDDLLSLQTWVASDGNSLKARGQGVDAGAGTDTSGFSALLAGSSSGLTFSGRAETTRFWSSTQHSVIPGVFMYAWTLSLSDVSGASAVGFSGKGIGNSVRCLED